MISEKCRNFTNNFMCCRLLFDNPFDINIKDLIPNCKGFSNISQCCWFITTYMTEIELKSKRKELRKLRQELGL